MPPDLSPRRTRQKTRLLTDPGHAEPPVLQRPFEAAVPVIIDLTSPDRSPQQTPTEYKINHTATLPATLTSKDTKLRKRDHQLLLQKQVLLSEGDIDIPRGFEGLSSAVNATLVFGQEEAGTAVCISAEGLLLTCSHCIAESQEDLDKSPGNWLLFASGKAVKAVCTAWNPKLDLALLKIVAAQHSTPSLPSEATLTNPVIHRFPFVELADAAPPLNSKMMCIGHPGSEDLEAAQPGVKTLYDVLHVSFGALRGYAVGQNLQDNSEIGALMHDCWTYWGHSGAPLIETKGGKLVGLHSSWDDETAMRRGIALEAISAFLAAHL